MTNRILRLMLVFALLANQAAICGAHSHHDSELSDHSARSHVHLSWYSHDHDSHDHDSSEHQHSDDQQPSGDSESSLDSNLPDDHDSDAIFFGDQDNFQHQSNRLIAKDLTSVSIWVAFEQLPIEKPAYQYQRIRAGPFSTHHCAIYLQTSRLLI